MTCCIRIRRLSSALVGAGVASASQHPLPVPCRVFIQSPSSRTSCVGARTIPIVSIADAVIVVVESVCAIAPSVEDVAAVVGEKPLSSFRRIVPRGEKLPHLATARLKQKLLALLLCLLAPKSAIRYLKFTLLFRNGALPLQQCIGAQMTGSPRLTVSPKNATHIDGGKNMVVSTYGSSCLGNRLETAIPCSPGACGRTIGLRLSIPHLLPLDLPALGSPLGPTGRDSMASLCEKQTWQRSGTYLFQPIVMISLSRMCLTTRLFRRLVRSRWLVLAPLAPRFRIATIGVREARPTPPMNPCLVTLITTPSRLLERLIAPVTPLAPPPTVLIPPSREPILVVRGMFRLLRLFGLNRPLRSRPEF